MAFWSFLHLAISLVLRERIELSASPLPTEWSPWETRVFSWKLVPVRLIWLVVWRRFGHRAFSGKGKMNLRPLRISDIEDRPLKQGDAVFKRFGACDNDGHRQIRIKPWRRLLHHPVAFPFTLCVIV